MNLAAYLRDALREQGARRALTRRLEESTGPNVRATPPASADTDAGSRPLATTPPKSPDAVDADLWRWMFKPCPVCGRTTDEWDVDCGLHDPN